MKLDFSARLALVMDFDFKGNRRMEAMDAVMLATIVAIAGLALHFRALMGEATYRTIRAGQRSRYWLVCGGQAVHIFGLVILVGNDSPHHILVAAHQWYGVSWFAGSLATTAVYVLGLSFFIATGLAWYIHTHPHIPAVELL